MRVILLIMIGVSLLHAELTRDAATGIVTDSATKLMWQDNEIGESINWQGAIDRCEALELGGHSDWRLPNINELRSIVDRSKVNPAMKDGFDHTSLSNYWSSTTSTAVIADRGIFFGERAHRCDFGDGTVSHDLKIYNYYVRCVRTEE